MHKGSARRGNPAAPTLCMRGGLTILRLAILLAGPYPMIPRTYGASQGSGDTRCDTRGAPHCVALYSVNSAPDFFQDSERHPGGRPRTCHCPSSAMIESKAVSRTPAFPSVLMTDLKLFASLQPMDFSHSLRSSADSCSLTAGQ